MKHGISVLLRLLLTARAMRFHLDTLAKQIPGHLRTLMSYVTASALSWMREMKKGDATLMLLHTRCRQWCEAESPGNGGIWQRQNVRILSAVVAHARRSTWNCGHVCETAILAKHKPFWPDRFTPGSLLTEAELSPTIWSLRGTFKMLFSLFIFYSCKKHPGH